MDPANCERTWDFGLCRLQRIQHRNRREVDSISISKRSVSAILERPAKLERSQLTHGLEIDFIRIRSSTENRPLQNKVTCSIFGHVDNNTSYTLNVSRHPDPNHSKTGPTLSHHDEHVTMINRFAALRHDESNACEIRTTYELVTEANRASCFHFESWPTVCQSTNWHYKNHIQEHSMRKQIVNFTRSLLSVCKWCDIQKWVWWIDMEDGWRTRGLDDVNTSTDRIASVLWVCAGARQWLLSRRTDGDDIFSGKFISRISRLRDGVQYWVVERCHYERGQVRVRRRTRDEDY